MHSVEQDTGAEVGDRFTLHPVVISVLACHGLIQAAQLGGAMTSSGIGIVSVHRAPNLERRFAKFAPGSTV